MIVKCACEPVRWKSNLPINYLRDFFFSLAFVLLDPCGPIDRPPHFGDTHGVAMAQLLRLGEKIARRAVVNRGAVQSFARPFAANPLAVHADDDSFLKWTTPEPQQFVHAGILAAPETKVRSVLTANSATSGHDPTAV